MQRVNVFKCNNNLSNILELVIAAPTHGDRIKQVLIQLKFYKFSHLLISLYPPKHLWQHELWHLQLNGIVEYPLHVFVPQPPQHPHELSGAQTVRLRRENFPQLSELDGERGG